MSYKPETPVEELFYYFKGCKPFLNKPKKVKGVTYYLTAEGNDVLFSYYIISQRIDAINIKGVFNKILSAVAIEVSQRYSITVVEAFNAIRQQFNDKHQTNI